MPEYVDLLLHGRWVLAVILVATMLDVMIPFVPAETIVVAVGVATAEHGHPALLWVILAATAGVAVGDHCAYAIGSRSGPAVLDRLRGGRRGAALHDWVLAVMRRHGGPLIVFGRYVPGVRSATAFTAGAVRHPRRRFAGCTLLGAALWAAQAALLGYLGGMAFASRPLAGLAAAWLAAVAVSAVAMLVQHRISRVVARRNAAPARGRQLIEATGPRQEETEVGR